MSRNLLTGFGIYTGIGCKQDWYKSWRTRQATIDRRIAIVSSFILHWNREHKTVLRNETSQVTLNGRLPLRKNATTSFITLLKYGKRQSLFFPFLSVWPLKLDNSSPHSFLPFFIHLFFFLLLLSARPDPSYCNVTHHSLFVTLFP